MHGMKNEAQYRSYLTEYKTKNHPSAPATPDEYADFWIDAVKQKLKELKETGKVHRMHFKPFQKDGPLLVVTKEGKLPEKNINYFEACEGIGLDLGYSVMVEYIPDEDGGIIVLIKVK